MPSHLTSQFRLPDHLKGFFLYLNYRKLRMQAKWSSKMIRVLQDTSCHIQLFSFIPFKIDPIVLNSFPQRLSFWQQLSIQMWNNNSAQSFMSTPSHLPTKDLTQLRLQSMTKPSLSSAQAGSNPVIMALYISKYKPETSNTL